MTKLFLNSIPHSGTHFVAEIVERLGYTAAERGWRLSFPQIEEFRDRESIVGKIRALIPVSLPQPYSLNWAIGGDEATGVSSKGVLVSVGSPRYIAIDVVQSILSRVNRGEYLIGHVPYSERMGELIRRHGFRTVLVVRDPRAMVLSMLDHIRERPEHVAYKYLIGRLNDRQDRLLALIEGYDSEIPGRGIVGIEEMYDSISEWAAFDQVLVVRYEELLSEAHRYEDGSEITERIAKHIGVDIDTEAAQEIIRDAYGSGSTFRHGKGRRWEEELDPADASRIIDATQGTLGILGYNIPT